MPEQSSRPAEESVSDFDVELAKEFNNLRGRILGLIEACGLPRVQEAGMKSTFKSLTYDSQARLSALIKD